MTANTPEDLISAFFDGEVSPEERAEVERLLGSASNSAAELRETQNLSQSLRNLPRHAAPEGFQARVMQLAERSVLLAAPTAEVAATPAPRSSSRAWWFAGGSILATAAGLFLMVTWLGTVNRGQQEMAVFEHRIAEPSGAAGASTSRVADAEGVALPSITNTIPAPPADAPMAQPTIATVERDSTLVIEAGLVFSHDLNEAEVGQVLEAVDSTEGQVAVFKVTVLDIQKGRDALEVLLMKQKVEREQDALVITANQPVSGEAPQMAAVYVQANRKQLTESLLALKDDAQFENQRLAISEQIPVSEVSMVTNGEVQPSLLDDRVPMSAAPPPVAKNSDIANEALELVENAAKPAEEPAAPKLAKENSDEAGFDRSGPRFRAFQQRLQAVPSRFAVAPQFEQKQEMALGARRQAIQAVRPEPAPVNDQQPVQVLFVLTPAQAAESPVIEKARGSGRAPQEAPKPVPNGSSRRQPIRPRHVG